MRTRGLEEVCRRLGDIPGVISQLQPKARVLEVGCGFGNSLKEIAELFPQAELWGMNREQYPEQWVGPTYVYGDAAEGLPLESEMFDLVYSIVTLYFLRDRARFIEEAFRVLKPGGQLRINLHRDVGPKAGDYRIPDLVEGVPGVSNLLDYILTSYPQRAHSETTELAEVLILTRSLEDPPLDLGLKAVPERLFDYEELFGDPASGFLRNVFVPSPVSSASGA